jgi:hypothetical protein
VAHVNLVKSLATSYFDNFSEGVGSGTGSTQPRDRIN